MEQDELNISPQVTEMAAQIQCCCIFEWLFVFWDYFPDSESAMCPA